MKRRTKIFERVLRWVTLALLLAGLGVCLWRAQGQATNYVVIEAGNDWQSVAWAPVWVTLGTNAAFRSTIITQLVTYRPVRLVCFDGGTNGCSVVLSNVVLAEWHSNIVWASDEPMGNGVK